MDPSVLAKVHDTILQVSNIEEIVVCPHDNDDRCNCRKPKPGMVEYILRKYSLNAERVVMVGDTIKDAHCALAAGVSAILLNTEYNQDVICPNMRRTNSLVDLILKEGDS